MSSAPDLPTLPLGSDSVMWRVATEPAFLLPSGPRALLLQVAHPVVGAGVADHSDYESRPWVRLIATLDVMNKLAFGTPEGSARQATKLRERHAAITGSLDTGERYRALDAHNMLWVWATLVDTLVVSYERYVRPLGRAERDELYREWQAIGRACGVPLAVMPGSWDEFQAYVASVELEPTATAVAVSEQILRPPLGPLAGPVGRALALVTAPVLPDGLRAALGLPEPTAAADTVASAARRVARLTPGGVRRAPLRAGLTLWCRPPVPVRPSTSRPRTAVA